MVQHIKCSKLEHNIKYVKNKNQNKKGEGGEFLMKYMTVAEVSNYFFDGKISRGQIYNLIKNGEISAIRVGSKYLVLQEPLIEKFGKGGMDCETCNIAQ